MTPRTNNQMPMQRINWRKHGCVGLQLFIIRFLNACIFDEVHVMLIVVGRISGGMVRHPISCQLHEPSAFDAPIGIDSRTALLRFGPSSSSPHRLKRPVAFSKWISDSSLLPR